MSCIRQLRSCGLPVRVCVYPLMRNWTCCKVMDGREVSAASIVAHSAGLKSSDTRANTSTASDGETSLSEHCRRRGDLSCLSSTATHVQLLSMSRCPMVRWNSSRSVCLLRSMFASWDCLISKSWETIWHVRLTNLGVGLYTPIMQVGLVDVVHSEPTSRQ